LAELIYEPKYFGEECHLYTDSGKPSTDKEVLEELAKAGSPIAKLIQECRLDERMISTFVGPMLGWLEKQGDLLLHCDFLPHGTKTGRLSCRSPNLQQIPNKSKGLIKRLFVSRYGEDGVFIQVDFSQIELRILAAVTGDEKMLRVYQEGGDIHAMNACMIFKLTPEEFAALDKDTKKRYRTIAKRIGFGVCYGIGIDGIQSTLKSEGIEVDLETAQKYLDGFFSRYPTVGNWIEKVQTETGVATYSRSLFGRRRRLAEIKSYVSGVRAGAERQAINHVIQSTAADVTNTALILFDQEVCIRQGADPELLYPTVEHRNFPVDHRWKRVHPILQVHDMLGVDAHREVAGEVLERLVWTMEHSVELSPLVWGDVIAKGLRPLNAVPIVADPEVGPNWRDAYKAKDRGEIDKAMHVSRAKRTFFDGNPLGDWTPELEKAALDAYGAKGKK
jgi:DNA polymerase I-like protein with 3'-5' exonuclease and polymerase domains